MSSIEKYIDVISDFPKKGVVFKDLSPVFRHHFHALVSELSALFTEAEIAEIDFIAGVESRGFIVGAALAQKWNKGFVPIRKAGKLPPKVARQSYVLEYGTDTLEMHYGNGRILLVDDVLATGGTLLASAKLCEETGHKLAGILCILNLAFLNSFSFQDVPLKCLITYKAP